MVMVRRERTAAGEQNYLVEYDPSQPPEVFFDTNVWLNMSRPEEQVLQRIKEILRFRYRYSITNYVELLSQWATGPTARRRNPFGMVRAAFRKISRLCAPEVLPSPEMVHLESAGLLHYLHPDWAPDVQQIAAAVDLIARAQCEGDITGYGIQSPASLILPRAVLDPRHYARLTQTDDASMRSLMADLQALEGGSLTRDNISDQLHAWFLKIAAFFLLFRPSSGETTLPDVSPEERDRFWDSFTRGSGRMFHAHITLIAIKTVNWRERVDPNDLYDAMQLLLLTDNRLFVTNDKNFLRHAENSCVQGVLPWDSFKGLPISME